MRKAKQENATAGGGTRTSSAPLADDPRMSDRFAHVYEHAAHRVTGPVSEAALARIGPVGRNTRVLDIAAGAGALSVPAAQAGASVLAVDHARGMVRRLSERLAAFPGCEARVMSGEALDLEDAGFDAAFAIFAFQLFADWRGGLHEMARVLKPDGRGCVATWRKPAGGGPFLVMAEAVRAALPDLAPPPRLEGMVALSDPKRLADEMRGAGFTDVTVGEIEAVWEGPPGEAYLEELKDLHGYMPVYAMLNAADRRKVDAAILRVVDGDTHGGRVVLRSPALIAVGKRA